MGRVIAIGVGGKAQAPVRDDRARGLIDYVAANGMLGQLLLSPPCKTFAEADELRRALYRSSFYYCTCNRVHCTRKHRSYQGGCPDGGLRVSCHADVVKDPKGRLRVQFCLRDKAEAMRYMVTQYGSDVNEWPYNPRAKKNKENKR